MAQQNGVYKLKGVVQNYSWGGVSYIPGLIGIDNAEGKPFAEYWLGAHPNHPSLLENQLSLKDYIAQNPSSLGSIGATGTLPYLLKILDVRQMLSIQVHPSKESARAGFEEEEKKGLALTAPNRNYKDQNHKPELMVALSDFWLLHGFKNDVNMDIVFNATPELQGLRSFYEKGSYKGLYEEVMTMEQEKVNTILQPLLHRILPLYETGELEKDEEDFWASRAALNFCRNGQYDRGIFSIYFFNLVYLKSGEGVFQPQGMPHAYLEGQNVEIMANSDNVLRAGLTDKHIDVAELMKHVKFEATTPEILSPVQKNHRVFQSPAEEFELHQYLLDKGQKENIDTISGEIFLVTKGEAELNVNKTSRHLKQGEAAFVSAGNTIEMVATEDLVCFRSTVPQVQKTSA